MRDVQEPTEPALSPSCAHDLLDESPLYAWTYHRKLGGVPSESTESQEAGRLYHALILGDVAGQQQIVPCMFDSFRSAAAKDARDEARAKGMIPIIASKYEQALKTVPLIQESLRKRGLDFSGGHAEQKLHWQARCNETLDDVLCSGVPDWLSADRSEIRELKFMPGSAHPERACMRLLTSTHGIYQHAAYIQAVEELEPDLAGRVGMRFIFIQTSAPFDVVPMLFGGQIAEYSERKWSSAVTTWNRCRKTGIWAPYTPGDYVANLPTWLAREMEADV